MSHSWFTYVCPATVAILGQLFLSEHGLRKQTEITLKCWSEAGSLSRTSICLDVLRILDYQGKQTPNMQSEYTLRNQIGAFIPELRNWIVCYFLAIQKMPLQMLQHKVLPHTHCFTV